MIRLLILYGQPKDPEGFLKYYNEVHIPIAKKMKGLKGWTIGKVIGTPGGEPTPYFSSPTWWRRAGAPWRRSWSRPKAGRR